ncbi:MAG: hypothetical protein WC966_01240 [Bradymonadales bacterium]|jgi:hypothetical protein
MNRALLLRLLALGLLAAGLSYSCKTKTANREVLEQASEIAEYLCKYSNGGFPAWFLADEMKPYLSDGEYLAMKSVAQEMLAGLSEDMQNRELAISQFLRENTHCVLMESSSPDEDTRIFHFKQRIPQLSAPANPSDPSVQAWLSALRSAQVEAYNEQTASLVLERSGGGWKVRSFLQDSYAKPIKALKKRRTIDDLCKSRNFESALTLATQLCSELEDCGVDIADIRSEAARSEQARRYELELKVVKTHTLAASSDKLFCVVEFLIHNEGERDIRELWLEGVGVEAQSCLVQDRLSLAQGSPLVLRGGEKKAGFCRVQKPASQYRVLDLLF